jgi:cytochrome c556
MRNKLFFVAVAVFVLTIFYSCSQENREQSQTPVNDTLIVTQKDTVEGNFTDPNEPSELAALMREMFTTMETMQTAIKANQIPVDVRAKFATMKTAKATEPEMIEEPFGAMADVFLKNMDKLYDTKNQVEDYNLVVESCLACHQNQCPGPMVRIKKLLIK